MFLRPDNFCALQVASVAAGRHPWDLKPFYCSLYPLMLTNGVLRLDDTNVLYENKANCLGDNSDEVPGSLVYKDELILALGQTGYDVLVKKTETAGESS